VIKTIQHQQRRRVPGQSPTNTFDGVPTGRTPGLGDLQHRLHRIAQLVGGAHLGEVGHPQARGLVLRAFLLAHVNKMVGKASLTDATGAGDGQQSAFITVGFAESQHVL